MSNQIFFGAFVGFLLIAGLPAASSAQVSTGISLDSDGLRGFYLSVGDYYHVPEREVIVVRERRVPDDELPVVFFMASHAHVAPGVIVDLRLDGWSWSRISLHYGVGPDVYYVPVAFEVSGPPYGNAYGHYKKRPKKEWSTIRLTDSDIVNFVNLRFISHHMGIPPEDVIRMRSGGKSFTVIHEDVRKIQVKEKAAKGGKRSSQAGKAKDAKEKGGKGKGKGKSK